MTSPSREGLTEAVDQIEGVYRSEGKKFLIAFGSALRTRKLYPLENEQVQKSFDELAATARTLHQVDPTLEMQISEEFVYINKTRLRLGLEQYSALGHVMETFKNAGAGIIAVDEAVSREEWQELMSVLVEVKPHEDPHDYLEELLDALERLGVTHISLARAAESDQELDAEERAREVARRTYRQ
ncbi:MAG: hypothetical protein OEZ54_06905, partial [Gemmatimonadota bacterium]|nr:hypothetical protein [Gemmatimonadota bacterium]